MKANASKNVQDFQHHDQSLAVQRTFSWDVNTVDVFEEWGSPFLKHSKKLLCVKIQECR